MDKKQALAVVKEKQARFIEINDRIWEYAEMAFREYKSAALLCEALEEEGFTVTRNVAGIETAFTGSYGHGKPVIGVLGEFDALSAMNQKGGSTVKEPVSPEDARKPGHGCGHNSFAAGSRAAAVAVKEYLMANPDKSGTVIFFGCPGEEGGSGKTFMARDGVFDGLDAAIVWHPGVNNGVRSGSSLANQQIEYSFHGVAAHASAAPYRGRSAYDAVELMNIGVQFLREHMLPSERIHYAVTDTGGLSPNVVQAESTVLYLIRSKTNRSVKELVRRVDLVAQGAATMTETTLTRKFIKGCSNIVDNRVLGQVMYENLKQAELPTYTEEERAYCRAMVENTPGAAFDKPCIQEEVKPYEPKDGHSSGSSDVGDVSWICPTVWLEALLYPTGTPGHSWQRVSAGVTSMAHKGLLLAGEVMAGAVIDLLDDPALVEQAKQEHAQRLADQPYECPIPAGVEPRPMEG